VVLEKIHVSVVRPRIFFFSQGYWPSNEFSRLIYGGVCFFIFYFFFISNVLHEVIYYLSQLISASQRDREVNMKMKLYLAPQAGYYFCSDFSVSLDKAAQLNASQDALLDHTFHTNVCLCFGFITFPLWKEHHKFVSLCFSACHLAPQEWTLLCFPDVFSLYNGKDQGKCLWNIRFVPLIYYFLSKSCLAQRFICTSCMFWRAGPSIPS